MRLIAVLVSVLFGVVGLVVFLWVSASVDELPVDEVAETGQTDGGMPAAKIATINGHEVEYWLAGVGETVVFVHGSMGDETFAMFDQPSLTQHFRVLHYHRRGFGRSQASEVPMTSGQAAANLRALMQHLGIDKAHFVGQSLGGLVVLQLALDAPTMVQSLALLEPALPAVLFGSQEYAAATGPSGPLAAAGDTAGAIEAFAPAGTERAVG